ncbi:MAG TPA: serine/threonine-protein kinase [Kofleriaceae bacterium]|jgi:serine/threonine-protein kinase
MPAMLSSTRIMFVCSECGAAQGQAGFCPSDGTPLVPIGDDTLLGAQIGPYRIARLLGIGGMGRVYKGVHPQIGSRVAIKVLSRECSDRPDLVERFFSEAKAVNVIRHENIVNVLDLATLPDGRPYIVMEYLDGAPLASAIEAARTDMPLSIGGIARLASEVLDALGAAHGKGIIHRDLKPDNIFVTPSGRAKVLDFGIAKLVPELGGSATHTGSLLGTPQYMSPEQAAGKPVDARADLYAIGVILFECATLQKPFVADSLFALLRAHIEAQPPLPRALRPDLPPQLEHVILTALAKTPEQRFASAQAMNLALQHATQQLTAEQWTPITPGAARSSSGGWVPTAPASWRTGERPQQGTTSIAAGQQATPPARKGHSGLWISLVAALLVGGGITAAMVAGKSSSAASTDVPIAAANEPVAQPLPVVHAQTPAPAAPAVPAPTQIAAPEPTAPAVAPAPVATTPNPNLVERHPVAPPNFDPKHVDVDKFVVWAIAEATRDVPDAKVTRVDADNVFPDGHADLTLPSFASPTGSIDVRFVSPSHMTRDPKLPRGVRSERVCEFRVMIEPSGGEIYATGGDCDEAPIPRPRCSATAVWKKALAIKRDLSDAVAELTYTANIVTHQIVWMFDVRDGTKSLFSEQFPDNC